MYGGENLWIVTIGLAAIFVIAARILIEKIMDTPNSIARFGMGIALFLIYTVVMLLVFNYFCVNWNDDSAVATAQECFLRICSAFVIVNAAVLIIGSSYYFAREKRKMSEMERIKLKDI